MAYIKYQRGFRCLPIFTKSSLEQREVLHEIIDRIQYQEKVLTYDGSPITLRVGDVWLSRGSVLQSVHRCGSKTVEGSHYRYMVEKLIKENYMALVCTSRKSGSIYECSERFFNEIAVVFDDRKLTNQQPTNNQPITNQQPTNNQLQISDNNGFNGVVTNQQPTNNQPTTNQQPTNNHNIKNKEKEERINTITIIEKSDFEIEKVSLKSNFEIQRKKVAAKKESFEFPAAPAEYEVNPLDAYFSNIDNLQFWAAKYPLLEMESEFEKIKAALNAKAANGDAQMRIPYNYVLKCLNNAEIERQQRIKAQNNQINKPFKNGNDWVRVNSKS